MSGTLTECVACRRRVASLCVLCGRCAACHPSPQAPAQAPVGQDTTPVANGPRILAPGPSGGRTFGSCGSLPRLRCPTLRRANGCL